MPNAEDRFLLGLGGALHGRSRRQIQQRLRALVRDGVIVVQPSSCAAPQVPHTASLWMAPKSRRRSS